MKLREILLAGFIFCIMAILLYSDAQKDTSGSYNIPDKDIKRIISLSPSNTEILYALGAENEIVGVTSYCDYPPAALSKEKIGSFYNPDIEKVISLKPDIVFANSTLQAEAIRQLRRAGVAVMPVHTENMEELYVSIKSIASVIRREKEGAKLSGEMDAYRDEAKSILSKYEKRKNVFIEVWDRPILTVGSESYLNALIKEAGGNNLAEAIKQDYFSWDIEKIYAANPDVYLRLRGTDMGSTADVLPGKLKELDAVKNGHVVTVFGDWIVRPGPRSFAALPTLIKAIYEEKGTDK